MEQPEIYGTTKNISGGISSESSNNYYKNSEIIFVKNEEQNTQGNCNGNQFLNDSPDNV